MLRDVCVFELPVVRSDIRIQVVEMLVGWEGLTSHY